MNQENTAFSYRVWNLGCKCNRYEADAVALYFSKQGGREAMEEEEADICLLNTCTVTAEAGRKSRQALRRLRRENPEAILAVMGCHSQLEDMAELVDLQTGVEGRIRLAEDCLTLWKSRKLGKDDPSLASQQVQPREHDYEELGLVELQSETRAQIKICDGCEQYCSYCAICLARGKVRSRSRESILEEAKILAERGVKEIILTATHLCSFEREMGRDTTALVELLEALDEVDGIERIRLGSLEPASLTEDILRRMAKVKKLCPHFHLSLQSGSDTVLKRMRRRYTTAEYAKVCSLLRQLFDDPSITTDIMVGFAEESEEEFEESLAFVEKIAFSRIHVFRYSVRENTAAARMQQVDPEISRERSERLQELADRLARESMEARLGSIETIILEELQEDGGYTGTSERYDTLYLPAVYLEEPPQIVGLSCLTEFLNELKQEELEVKEKAPLFKQGELLKVKLEALEGDRIRVRPV